MRLPVLAAAAVIGALCATLPAQAADLGEDEYPQSDSYEYGTERYSYRGESFDSRTYEVPPARYPSGQWRDEHDVPPPRRLADEYAPREDGCVPRRAIRDHLVTDGWSGFHDLEIRGRSAHIRARRPDGRLYALKLDRCSGQIVRARPVDDYALRLPRGPWHRDNWHRDKWRGDYLD